MANNSHNSSSDEQQSAEEHMRKSVNERFGLNLTPEKGVSLGLARADFDGIDRDQQAVSEMYAHIGNLKGNQPDKVMDDIAKMLLLERMVGGSWTKLIVFQDKKAAQSFSHESKSRTAEFCRQFEIKVVVTDLGSEIRGRIEAAQERQHMSNTMNA